LAHREIGMLQKSVAIGALAAKISGGGVIGACTAYFLSRCGIDVERSEVAAAASGKAGGFLALELTRA
jgi:hypothetical protein